MQIADDGRESGTMSKSQAVIRVEKYSFAYESNPDQLILKDISFAIEPGTISAMIGLSGCGKTTLCQSLCGIIPNCTGGKQKGKIFIQGNDIEGLSVNQLAATIGYVMQNPDEQLVCTTVEDELAFAPENLARNPDEMKEKVDWALRILGMEPFRLKNPNQLSGGQKQMVAIGAVLMLDPEILVLDEPMSSLDLDGKRIIRQLMLTLKDLGKTILIVEHDIESLQFTDRWIVLSEGNLVAQGNPIDFMRDKTVLIENKLV